MFLSRINRADDKTLGSAREERQFLLLSDRQKKGIWSIAYASLVFYLGKILRRKFLFRSRPFVVFFSRLVWEKRVDVLGEKCFEIGTTQRVTRDFLLPSRALLIYVGSLVLSRDNVKCTHRLSLSSRGRNSEQK